MKSDYDAFISYRRGDASPIAHWIRHRLQKYKLPDDILPKLSVDALELHKRRPRVFIDRAYEKANEDFLKSKIFPALDASHRLIVISTPSVFDNIREADGTEAPNWLVREIDHFVSKPNTNTSRKIELVLGPGGEEQQFPGRLSEKARWDWIDLRAFNKWRAFGFSEELDSGFLKLIASIYDVPEEALPLLRREERRRRQKLIISLFAGALFFTAIISILAIGWWGEIKSRQATELERQQVEARNLIDVGSIPNAVNILAKIVLENGEANAPEATRLLKAWSKRLVTARDELETVPKNSVFRWRGRNYLRSDNGISFSFDGPAVLLGGVSSDKQLITFEADRVLRVRDLDASTVPIIETRRLSATPKVISEYFQGKLLIFEATGLYLNSDEDAEDAQEEYGSVMVVLDSQTKIYAILESFEDEIQFNATGNCIQIESTSVNLVDPNQTNKTDQTDANQTIVISQKNDGAISWNQGATGSCSQNISEADPHRQHEPDARHILAKAPENIDAQINFGFPGLIEERLLWPKVGLAPIPEVPSDICSEKRTNADCYSIKQTKSIIPKSDSTLETILRDQELPLELIQLDMLQRAIVTTVLGNQFVGYAVCDVKSSKAVKNCVVATSTARTSREVLASGQFMSLNSLEVHEGTFQLIDLNSLRLIQVNPPPMEKLADINISQEGKWMAAITKAGEVWLYELNRKAGTATIAARFNFRSMINNPGANTPTESAQGGENVQDQFFDSAFFVSENHLVLAGSLGGIVLVEIPGGNIIWSRIPIALSGNSKQNVAAAGDTLAIYNTEAIQLVSLESGALLSNIMNFKDLPFNADDKVDEFEIPVVESGPSGDIQVIYGGAIFEPFSDFPVPSLQSVEQRTGISRGGTDELLSYYLKGKSSL
jgi:hypothetical protein